MDICIRNLEESDLPSADEVLTSAFGGTVSRVDDLRLYREIQPDGWFVAENEGRLVGMVGAASYGALAHVGLMAVRPDCQRQGIGKALMEHLLAWLDRQPVPLVTLDASKMGLPLYEQLGFVPYDETYTYQRSAGFALPPSRVAQITPEDVDEIARVDQAIFGADRRKVFQVLLQHFPGRAVVLRDDHGHLEGYLCAQKFRIGPWAMLNPDMAEGLLKAALSLSFEGIISLTVPSSNHPAVDLLHQYGFERVRTNRRMGRGSHNDPCQRQRIFSQTSLAVG